ncbi:MAG: DUF3298 domain-containing protein [Candidatus Magasanikbacteria bacterium]
MLNKIGWGILLIAVLVLVGVAFFQKYTIVPRLVAPKEEALIDTVQTVVSSTSPIATPVAVQLISLDIGEETASYTIKVFYPAMIGGEEKIRNSFNAEIKTLAEGMVVNFKEASLDAVSSTDSKNFLTGAYDVKEQNDNFISIFLSGEQYVAGAAHPSHSVAVFNFNLKTGQIIKLKDLFVADAKYLEVLSNYCKKELLVRNGEEEFTNRENIQSGTLAKEDLYDVFSITLSGLVVIFPEYQVAPYVAGAQMVTVPWSDLKEIIDVNGPVAIYLPAEKVSTATSASSPQLIGGQKDEHGCLVGAGYSWCPSTNKCQRMWEEYCVEYKDIFRSSTKK